jgi:hypothetical protein
MPELLELLELLELFERLGLVETVTEVRRLMPS